VVLVLDDHGYRENVVTMPLPKHPKFETLKGASQVAFSHRQLVDFLRLNFRQELATAAPTFLERIRNIKINEDQTGESVVHHGRESMGKSIDLAVAGASDIPDEVTLRIPVWLHLEFLVDVECAFDIHISEAKFLFRPKPGAIEQAMVAAQQWLHMRLSEECGEHAVIYFGQP
jgi:hypothetical protein